MKLMVALYEKDLSTLVNEFNNACMRQKLTVTKGKTMVILLREREIKKKESRD